MVDEYETEFELPIQSSVAPLSAEEALAMFDDAEPSPTDPIAKFCSSPPSIRT